MMRIPIHASARGGISLWIAAVLVAASALVSGAARAAELEALAHIGPWPAVSNLIEYRGRIWFANSVRSPDHNSADVYSYDPEAGTARFERTLFTQDVGRPTLHRGLLYWPYEDPRTNVSWGLVAATDGRAWRLFVIPSAEPSFHVHALASGGRRLIASSSAWIAGLDVSDDGGLSWRRIYQRAAPERGIARILDFATDGSRAYGAGVQWSGRTADRFALDIAAGAVAELPGWPQDETSSLAVFRGALHAAVGGALWTASAAGAARIYANGAGPGIALIAADGDELFGLVQSGDHGTVMSSRDGRAWSPRFTFAGGRAEDMIVRGGRVFVGGRGADGRGILWGTRGKLPARTAAESADWPQPPAVAPLDGSRARRALDLAFADPANYGALGRPLRDVVWPMIQAKPAGDLFSHRLAGAFPEGRVNGFGGQVTIERADIGRWMLLWAMAASRTGRVPRELFARRWNEAPNRPQKWFHPTPIALFAARWLGQNDRETLDALVARLDDTQDPPWLRQELMGTLVALTGGRPGWEPAAWRAWWAQARPAWQQR